MSELAVIVAFRQQLAWLEARQGSLVELVPGRALHMACKSYFDMKASTSSRCIQHRQLSAGCAGLELPRQTSALLHCKSWSAF